MSYRISFETAFFPNHRQYSIILLKNLWTQGLRATFSNHDATELRFKPDDWAVMTVHSIHGLGWLWLPILPFVLLHESLHLIIAYFTPQQFYVRFIPPLFDFVYLPVAFLLIFQHPSFTSLIIGDWLCLGWIGLLMGNLQGDFRRTKSENPEKTEP